MSVRDIERAVYPAHMCSLQGDSLECLAEYCECSIQQLFVLQGDGWYLLAAEHHRSVEICDLAALPGHEHAAMRGLLTAGQRWTGKCITLDARETTSYPIIRRLARMGRITILKDEEYEWGLEVMHDMVLQL